MLRAVGSALALRREAREARPTLWSIGSEAAQKLITSNLRFVVSVAKRYQNQGVSLADLINEGTIGLMRAAQ